VAPQHLNAWLMRGEHTRIVEQLRDEDREFDEAMNADSSDDDEDVLKEWVSSNFSHLIIDERPSVP
jgi:Zn-finger nucleic acid-binding protein